MVEPIKIPISFFELAIDYVRAEVKLLSDRAPIVQGMFDALQPWNPSIDEIEVRTAGKPSEQGINFRLPLKRIAFFFGAASCKFTRDDADWESAEETITILDAFISSLVRLGGVEMGPKKAAIAMHLQPRSLPFMEILKPFVAPSLAGMNTLPLQTMAVVAKWEQFRVTLDGSGALANGIFAKIERNFGAATTYAEMAHQLRTDEEELFKVLAVEEDRG